MIRLLFLLLLCPCVEAATHYVDGSASGSDDGTSWTNAWTSPASITGVAAGDVVYLSGGPTGSSQTYDLSVYWMPAGGASGNRITYKIGQDSLHNGTAIFNYTGNDAANNPWLSGASYVLISGDAGDGRRHFRLTGYTSAISNVTGIKVEYVECFSGLLSAGDIRAVGSELSHCYFKLTDVNTDRAIYGSIMGTTWDDGLIIDYCTILVPYVGSGIGADGMQIDGTGITIHDCLIMGYYLASYAGGQHSDGWQGGGNSSYLKFYNNVFLNIPNYAIFGEGVGGGYSHVRIYNNIVAITDSSLAEGNPLAIVFGTSGGFSGTPPCVFNDVQIDNNTIVDYLTNKSIALNNSTGTTTNFTSCGITNNLYINSGTTDLTGNSSTTPLTNVSVSGGSGSATFLSYTEFGGLTNDLHPKASASTIVGQGTDLSSLFTTDKDGRIRSRWDIGALSAGGNVTADSVNAGVLILSQ